MLPEPYLTILLVLVVPVVVQVLKLAAAKLGKPIATGIVQALAFIIAGAFVYLAGGLAGLELPVFSGDPVAFLGALLVLASAAWLPIKLLYDFVLGAIFEKLGVA